MRFCLCVKLLPEFVERIIFALNDRQFRWAALRDFLLHNFLEAWHFCLDREDVQHKTAPDSGAACR